MALKVKIAELGDVPAALRAHYRVAEDGKGYVLDAEEVDGIGVGNIGKFKAQLAAAAKKQEATAARLLTKEDGSLYSREDIDALGAEVTTLKAQLADAATARTGDDEAVAAAVAAAKASLEEENAGLKKRVDGYQRRVLDGERERIVNRAIEQLRPMEEFSGFFKSELGRQLHIVESADGELHHTLLDDAGNPRPQSIEEMMPAWRTQYARVLKGDGKEGAGPLGHGHRAAVRDRNVTIPHNASQSDFERAFHEASQRGGEVVFGD